MKDLYIHNSSRLLLEGIVRNKPHAILLKGKVGTGLKTISKAIASELHTAPIFLTSDAAPTVETIRTIYQKTSHRKKSVMIVVIEDIEKSSVAAQNALLKLLEEPTKNTLFILTSHHPEGILPTIHSRVWPVDILPVSKQDTVSYIEKLGVTDDMKKTQLLYMANGLPAEIYRLVHESSYFDKRAIEIREARSFLTLTPYEKLVKVYKIGTDREQALRLIDDMAQLAKITVSSKYNDELVVLLEKLIIIKEKLIEDGNVRVQMLRLIT